MSSSARLSITVSTSSGVSHGSFSSSVRVSRYCAADSTIAVSSSWFVSLNRLKCGVSSTPISASKPCIKSITQVSSSSARWSSGVDAARIAVAVTLPAEISWILSAIASVYMSRSRRFSRVSRASVGMSTVCADMLVSSLVLATCSDIILRLNSARSTSSMPQALLSIQYI